MTLLTHFKDPTSAAVVVAQGARIMMSLLFIISFIHLFILVPTLAYRRYLSAIPNSGLVPCTTLDSLGRVVDLPGCRGTKICEALGHWGCYTGDPPGHPPLSPSYGGEQGLGTSFGNKFHFSSRLWSLAHCAADDDEDGFT